MKNKTKLLNIANFCKCCGAVGLPFCTAEGCLGTCIWKKEIHVKASQEVVKINCKMYGLSLKESL